MNKIFIFVCLRGSNFFFDLEEVKWGGGTFIKKKQFDSY